MVLYTCGYIDLIKNENVSLDETFTTTYECKVFFNSIIAELIYLNYSLNVNLESLFVHNTEFYTPRPYSYSFEINKKDKMTIIKNDVWSLDVYLEKNNDGYIFSDKKLVHVYKFYINSFTTPEIVLENSENKKEISQRKSSLKSDLPISSMSNIMGELTTRLKIIRDSVGFDSDNED